MGLLVKEQVWESGSGAVHGDSFEREVVTRRKIAAEE